jgi:Uma2 family endonuclease
VILDEPEHELGRKPDHVVPDLEIGPEGSPPYYDVAPDWVCEILSPRTEATDRGVKMRIHRRERVGHAWLSTP